MKNNVVKCPNCKEGKHLQKPLKNYPKEFTFYQCDVCSSVWELEKTTIIKDIRLHQNKGSLGSTIQVDYGNGWEKIKIHIEE